MYNSENPFWIMILYKVYIQEDVGAAWVEKGGLDSMMLRTINQ